MPSAASVEKGPQAGDVGIGTGEGREVSPVHAIQLSAEEVGQLLRMAKWRDLVVDRPDHQGGCGDGAQFVCPRIAGEHVDARRRRGDLDRIALFREPRAGRHMAVVIGRGVGKQVAMGFVRAKAEIVQNAAAQGEQIEKVSVGPGPGAAQHQRVESVGMVQCQGLADQTSGRVTDHGERVQAVCIGDIEDGGDQAIDGLRSAGGAAPRAGVIEGDHPESVLQAVHHRSPECADTAQSGNENDRRAMATAFDMQHFIPPHADRPMLGMGMFGGPR